ncbi:MAG: hypothetical protein Q9168_007903, partial [Polycauliona sp. 1 TL-2023]
MSHENDRSGLPDQARSSSPRPLSTRSATSSSSRSARPHYMTVGSGSTSASAAALMASIERDSGYGSMAGDSYIDSASGRGWHPGLTEDRPIPSHTPTYSDEYNPAAEKERRVLASHIHQLYYNQNRVKLGRSITQTVDTLQKLQEMNSTWPAQYPNVHQQEKDPSPTGPDPRPGLQHTHSTAVAGNIQRQKSNVPFRPSAPRRAGTSLGESSTTASSSASAEQTDQEPERLITPQAAHDFSVLKLDLKIQGLTQAEIAHSLEKSSVARILNGKIDSITRHLVRLRERIDDTSSKVLVTGDLNAGKSTFCNALLRRKVLPEDEQPCTSVFCEVLDARENAGIEEAHAIHRETVYDRNDESTYDVFSLFQLEKVVSDSTHYTQCKVYVKDIRTIDESLLNNGVVDISIIDAPGLNSDSLKTTAVFARQEEIDVVVFVVNAANHFTLSAKEFIWNAAIEKAYIFVVVNGYDNIKNKKKCQTAVLEQLQGLSPRTFKESSELVHFVSSNAIPVAPPPGPPNGGGAGGASGGDSDPSDESPLPMDEDEPIGKHGEPGSPPNKGKGKDKEKVQDFEQLEGALRRFVLEKRARSKLAPAKTYLLNILTDLHALATVNRDVAQSELDRVIKELEELEPAFEQSKKARSEVSDQVDSTIEDTCADIYSHTRSTLTDMIAHIAEADLGVPYDGLWSAFQYAEDIKFAMLDKIATSVTDCEDIARNKTMQGLGGIKTLGILHLGDKFAEVNFRPVDDMFTRRRDLLAREVDTDIEIWDFFDISALWTEKQEKLAGTSMALTVAGVLGGRMVGGVGWIDGALGAAKVMGTKNLRMLIVPGLVTA